MELPLAKGRRRDSKDSFFNGKEGRVGFRKKAFLNGKEGRDDFRKTDIRQSFPEPYASMYCQQFDNLKNVGDFFEYAVKLMRQ